MEYRRPRAEEEYQALAAILSNAFSYPADDARLMLRTAGDAEARVLAAGGEIQAGFVRRPMGQWWGGRSVPMLGVAAVGVPPHLRGSGVATTLMREAIREMYVDGYPLSVLFAASFPLYRRAGYELAGHVQETSVALVPLEGDHRLPMRPARDEDEPAMRELQREIARERNGSVDRSDVMWARQRLSSGIPCDIHVVEVDGRIDGYIAHVQRRMEDRIVLVVRDIVARNEAAGRRLLGFLAQHKAQVHRAVWTGDAADPIAMLINSRRYRVTLRDQWMLRVVDVPKALCARGYPDGVRATLHLDVSDDLLETNTGRWILSVRDGAGSVEPGGEGTLRVSARGLAPLYSGFLPPAILRRSGWIEADDDACATAATVFGGFSPHMVEQF